MKINKLIALCCSILLFSCSTDGEDDGSLDSNVSELVGVWDFTDIRFEDDPTDTSLNLADEIVTMLSAQDCILASFTFNEDGTAEATSSVEFLEINAGPTGLDVPCPTETTIETTTWSLEGNQLTFVNEDLEEETITIELDGNTLIISGENIDDNNFSDGDAVFTRR